MVELDDFLAHYGVKGMKWGKRRTRTTVELVNNSSGKSTKVTLPHGTTVTKEGNLTSTTKRSAKKASAALDAAGVKNMSDTELRERINRIQMERQYKQLTTSDTNPGKKFAKEFVGSVGKEIAKDYAKKYAKKGIEVGINAALKK